MFVLEVETAEDESVTFPVEPEEVPEEYAKWKAKGFDVNVIHFTPDAFAKHKAKLEMDTIFQGDDLPY